MSKVSKENKGTEKNAGKKTTKDIEDYIRARKDLIDEETADGDKFELANTTEHTVDISMTNKRRFAAKSRLNNDIPNLKPFPKELETVSAPVRSTTGQETTKVSAAPTVLRQLPTKGKNSMKVEREEEEEDLFENVLWKTNSLQFYVFVGIICTISFLLSLLSILHNTAAAEF